MGERGPKPEILQKLAPERRAKLDESIIEGSESKRDLYDRFDIESHGIGYRSFCKYATAFEQTARHRYVGELLVNVFGNLPDSEIDMRARGIMMGMLDRIASDVLHDRELKPRDLRHVVESYDILRKGSIAEAQEKRRVQEWEVIRMAGVAEASVWIKDALAMELGHDRGLCERINQAVDKCCASLDKPKDELITTKLLGKIAGKWKWRQDVVDAIQTVFGLKMEGIGGKPKLPKPTAEQVEAEILDVYGLPPEQGNDKQE